MYVRMHVLSLSLEYLNMYCTYAHTYIIIKICIHSVQILMSVLLKQIIAITTVQTLKEVSIVHVLWAIYWMMIGLLVMVCIQTCAYMTGSVRTSLTFLPFFTRSRLDLVLLFLIPNLVWFLYKIINRKCSKVSVSSKLL